MRPYRDTLREALRTIRSFHGNSVDPDECMECADGNMPCRTARVADEALAATDPLGEVFDFDAMPTLAHATTEERVALLRWREDAVRAALGGADLTQVLPGPTPGHSGLVRVPDQAYDGRAM